MNRNESKWIVINRYELNESIWIKINRNESKLNRYELKISKWIIIDEKYNLCTLGTFGWLDTKVVLIKRDWTCRKATWCCSWMAGASWTCHTTKPSGSWKRPQKANISSSISSKERKSTDSTALTTSGPPGNSGYPCLRERLSLDLNHRKSHSFYEIIVMSFNLTTVWQSHNCPAIM